MLLLLSQILPLCPPSPSDPYFLRLPPHHCSCPWVMHVSSLASPFPTLYFTSPWLFCNYLFILLNPLTSSLIPLYLLPIWQPSKCSPYPWFCLCSCLLGLFLDSIVDRCVFIAILLFIVLIFFEKISPFDILYNSGLVMMNSFSFFLSGKPFIYPLILNDSFAG